MMRCSSLPQQLGRCTQEHGGDLGDPRGLSEAGFVLSAPAAAVARCCFTQGEIVALPVLLW